MPGIIVEMHGSSRLGIIVIFHLIPISPGSITRGLYVVYMA